MSTPTDGQGSSQPVLKFRSTIRFCDTIVEQSRWRAGFALIAALIFGGLPAWWTLMNLPCCCVGAQIAVGAPLVYASFGKRVLDRRHTVELFEDRMHIGDPGALPASVPFADIAAVVVGVDGEAEGRHLRLELANGDTLDLVLPRLHAEDVGDFLREATERRGV